MQEAPKNSQNSSSGFIALIFLLAAAALYYYAEFDSGLGSNTQDVAPVVQANPKSEALVNKYLQETNKKIEIQKLRSSVENGFVVPKLGQLVPLKPEVKKPLDIDAPEDSDQKQLRQKLAPDVSRDEDSSPRSEVESQLADRQNFEDYDREYRRKYIQTFIENARKNGWDIQVNKQGIVIRANPIPGFDEQGQRMNVFDPTSSVPND